MPARPRFVSQLRAPERERQTKDVAADPHLGGKSLRGKSAVRDSAAVPVLSSWDCGCCYARAKGEFDQGGVGGGGIESGMEMMSRSRRQEAEVQEPQLG